MKMFQEVEKNTTALWNESASCSVMPPSSLNNIILHKASVLEEESWCEVYSEEWEKTLILLSEQSSVLYYWFEEV